MRLKFVKGKQRELINSFRIENKLSWNKLCKLLDIKYGRMMAYFNETSLIDEELYKTLDKNGKYSKYILEKLEENWGKRKGGVNSNGSTNKINFPEDSKELAEFYGIMLGDGNSYKRSFYNSREDKSGTYSIKIVGDSVKDKDYLFNHVKPLIDDLFDINSKLGKFNSSNAIFVQANGIKLVNFLESKGFKSGNKITNQLIIPEWIKKEDNYLVACLRGLYDTDGSVYKITNQNSYQICFTNYNLYLLKDVRDSLLRLGVNCSNISKHDVYITKKSELRKFLKLIGFSNNRHLSKVKMWKLDSPMV
jgi:intein/homing endonuclease